ncbi:MAG: sensor histidine kinase [Campylobacterales bacterium]|nr:sensor histidine kinase [Campylobacterales bacterium]
MNAGLIKKIEVKEVDNKNTSFEEIKKLKNFKEISSNYYKETNKTSFFKITFDKSKFKDDYYIIEIIKNNFQILLDKDINHFMVDDTILLSQNKHHFSEIVYLKIPAINNEVSLKLKEYKEKDYLFKENIHTIFVGLVYGIIFSAFSYYFALYFFNKERSYLYYCLSQLSILFLLVYISIFELREDHRILSSLFYLFFIFSNLFVKKFLNTKNITPKLDDLLTILIYIYTIDFILRFIYNYDFPIKLLLFVYLYIGVKVYEKGNKATLFFLIGWFIMLTPLVMIDLLKYYGDTPEFFNLAMVLHITIPLESLILAFALSYKMKLLADEKIKQQELLIHQNKLASMGEMLGNIAHQWRQPLTHLSYIIMNIKTAYSKNKLSEDYFEKKAREAQDQLEYMSHTIDDFRNFFSFHKDKSNVSLSICILECITLLKKDFESNDINLTLSYEKDCEVNIYKGEFLQVICNILNNAKDIFLEKDTVDSTLSISFVEKNKIVSIYIQDNAGGIPSDIINKIFEPYFTTKEKGLGMGLYMSKVIIEQNLKGKLQVYNKRQGALFLIELDNRKY